MDLSQLLRYSVILTIELHAGCLLLALFLYRSMRKSFRRNGREVALSLDVMYFGSIVMMFSDCLWTVLSTLRQPADAVGYAVNLVYFVSSSAGAAGWFSFCLTELETGLAKHSRVKAAVVVVPFAILNLLYLLSPAFGPIFSIQDGVYQRGPLFFLDPVIKIGYLSTATVLAIICGAKKKIGYLRKRIFQYSLFGIPVIVGGVLQIATGVDFNCLGVAFGLVIINVVGITNFDIDNTDAIYSLSNAFEASYIVNMDTGRIRPLHEDKMHDSSLPGMNAMDYTARFQGVLSRILLPEDRDATLAGFALDNVSKRFEVERSFSLRYRVKESSGQDALHTASFIRAEGDAGKNEFLLGISVLRADSLLYERNEALRHENQRLEQINNSIIESVAKMVEARDSGSGGHIIRVRKLTELLTREIMQSHPELHLDEEQVKLISGASVLHDVGKIVIPDAVLLKPGRLTEEEFSAMKTHSTKGCDILNMFPLGLDDAFLEYALSICRWHHEKYDGKGYPDGLSGEDIPIAAQIVSAADCFDALVSDRPYKKAFTPETALDMMLNGECGTFSPLVVSALQKERSELIKLVQLHP